MVTITASCGFYQSHQSHVELFPNTIAEVQPAVQRSDVGSCVDRRMRLWRRCRYGHMQSVAAKHET